MLNIRIAEGVSNPMGRNLDLRSVTVVLADEQS